MLKPQLVEAAARALSDHLFVKKGDKQVWRENIERSIDPLRAIRAYFLSCEMTCAAELECRDLALPKGKKLEDAISGLTLQQMKPAFLGALVDYEGILNMEFDSTGDVDLFAYVLLGAKDFCKQHLKEIFKLLAPADIVLIGNLPETTMLPTEGKEWVRAYKKSGFTWEGVKTSPVKGTCRICGCTEDQACSVNGDPCSWTDKTQTLCDNPKCIAAAKKAGKK
jgi:hypothetical protein